MPASAAPEVSRTCLSYNGIIPGSTGDSQHLRRSERFFKNVLWSWLGVAATIASGIFLSPYLIRKLGNEGYGIWVLAFGLMENYWLFDLGLRSATVKYAAHYRATGEVDKINAVISTGVAYFSALAFALLGGTFVLSRYVDRLFQVSPGYRETFATLVLLVGTSWSLGLIFNVFNACLEAFQRFDISSRIFIAVTVLRVCGVAVLLFLGYGIVSLGAFVVAAQVLGYVLSYVSLSRVFRGHRLSPRFASFAVFKQMAGYGIHTMTGGIASQLLTQAGPLLIGHFRPASFVGYFSVPTRLLQYTGDAVERVGLVSASNAAEMTARRDLHGISRLGIFVNRYCLALFAPLGVFLLVYGRDVIRVWIRKADFVEMSAPLLPILLLGTLLAVAAQFNTGSILYGLAKHGPYTRAMLAEGLALVAALYLLLPRYGIVGAAWAVSLLAVADRGLFAPWLLCRNIGFPFLAYMRSIYVRPLLTGVPVLLFAFWTKRFFAGGGLLQIAAAGASIGALYFAAAFFTCLEPEHRGLVLDRLRRSSSRFARIEAV